MQALQQRVNAQSRSYEAHLALLRRKTSGLEASRQKPNKELGKLVDKFISQQSGSEDACSSQLMEAKHQLNQIHDYVNDLSIQINSTEKAILALDKDMKDKLAALATLEEWRDDEIAKCQKQKEEAIEMFGKLSAEMEEMKQIASPGVAMDIQSGKIMTATGSLLSSKNAKSFVQTVVSAAGVGQHDGHAKKLVEHEYQRRNPTKDFQEVVALVKDTQLVAQNFLLAWLAKSPLRCCKRSRSKQIRLHGSQQIH